MSHRVLFRLNQLVFNVLVEAGDTRAVEREKQKYEAEGFRYIDQEPSPRRPHSEIDLRFSTMALEEAVDQGYEIYINLSRYGEVPVWCSWIQEHQTGTSPYRLRLM